MYMIWFDCCGLAVSAIILVSFYTRNSIPIVQNRVFIYQVWVALATTFCNLLLGIWQNEAFAAGNASQLAIASSVAFLYHTLRMVNAFLYVYYIIVVLDMGERSRMLYFGVYLPAAIALAVCILGLFWKPVFFFDANGIHHMGPLMNVLYLIAFYYLVAITYLTIYYRRAIPFSRQLAFHSFGVLVLGTVLVERLFPTIMIEGFGSVLCQLLIYLTIQRPEEVVDGSTGLLNKMSFLRMLSIRFRQRTQFELILITIDNLRFLEKSLGLRAWSKLMVEIAGYLRRLTRKAKAYHISQGTFCLMIPCQGSGEEEPLLEAIRARSLEPWKVEGLSVHLPACITLYHCPQDAATADEVIDLIEATLTRRQKTNREVQQEAGARAREVERAIRDALRKKSFDIVYQPIYSTANGRFLSAEALLRLHDEKLGDIRPDEFIPIAEKSGAIIEIGHFVLDQTCRFIQENRLEEMGIEYIEINLSVVECLQDHLVEYVLETLRRYGLKAGQINLEITETAQETFPETIKNNIRRLAENGLRFSLDDYGTGYSNIGRILTTPLDIIKLDRSILQAYFSDQTREADIILMETVQMLKKLDKSIVAEGVETEEQAECLIRMGCDFIQGYYYSKPLSPQAFLKLLSESQPRSLGSVSVSWDAAWEQ